MTLALVLYLSGYYFRQRDLMKHRILMGAGVTITILSALALLGAVHLIHGGDRAAAGFIAVADAWVILTHRVIATITFLMMFLMVWSGATRRRRIHVATARFFLPLFIIVYVSGLFIFTN